MLFAAAESVYREAGLNDRAQLLADRVRRKTSSSFDSSFFLNRPPTSAESAGLVTVLGGRNVQRFYEFLY